jgi:hypothetical protein
MASFTLRELSRKGFCGLRLDRFLDRLDENPFFGYFKLYASLDVELLDVIFGDLQASGRVQEG